MEDKRIHNDLNIAWGILHKGVPYSLEGKDVNVYLHSPISRTEVNDFKIEGNKVKWTFFGKDQKVTGKYSLELVINENEEGMVTTDFCNFVNLVACSCKVGGVPDSNVEIETIELTSTIEYIAGEGGGASYDDTAIWAEVERLEKDKADKTELANKQDTITDLATIREGASKGATALQSVPSTYATKTDVAQAISTAITNELNGNF